jgi:ATP-dependent RNA helicase DDX31/DBP7
LDEADRLMELGFERKLEEIFEVMKKKWEKKPQTLLISATLHSKINKLANLTLQNPIQVGFDFKGNEISKLMEFDKREKKENVFTIPSTLKQFYVEIPSKLRLVTLVSFLKIKTDNVETSSKIIVFFSSCASVEYHYWLFKSARFNDLKSEGDPILNVNVYRLHGDITQKERTKIYFDFYNANNGVLFCTGKFFKNK